MPTPPRRSLPWTLWIALLTLAGMATAGAWLAWAVDPVHLAAIPIPLMLLFGLARGRRWAYVGALVTSVLAPLCTAILDTGLLGLLIGLAHLPVFVPVLLCTWWFFPAEEILKDSPPEPVSPTRPWQMALVAAALLSLLTSQQALERTIDIRQREGLSVNPIREGVPPHVVLATTALGGFRGIFVDFLWLRCVAMKEEGKFYEMVQLYDWITNLQPNYSMVWRFAAWDLAYNVSVEFRDLEVRWFWIYRGIRYLRDKGIPYNRNDPEIYQELAWFYHHKLGATMDYAHVIYRTKFARMMESILGGSGERALLVRLCAIPDRVSDLRRSPAIAPVAAAVFPFGYDLVDDAAILTEQRENLAPELIKLLESPEGEAALETVRLFYMRRLLREDQKLDPALMLELVDRFGPLDWRSWDTHALYWGWQARTIRYKQLGGGIIDMKFERLVYFSLQELMRQGRILWASDGYAYTVPDYRFLEPAIAHLQDLLARCKDEENWKSARGKKVNITGMRSGYTYLVERCVFMYYFNGKLDEADRFMRILREEHPENKKYQVTAASFVQSGAEEWIQSMSVRRYMTIVEAKLRLSFLYLGSGDLESARIEEEWARTLYRYARKRWPYDESRDEQQFKYIAPIEDMAADLLVRILDGQESGFNPEHIARIRTVLGRAKLQAARDRVARKRQRTQENLQRSPAP